VIIESVHVENFRSIFNETLYCESLTALVGANGSGKSSFLHAIELFYNTSPRIEKEDFYGEDVSRDIIIAITFTNLDDENPIFRNYVDSGKLNVERVFTWSNGKILAKYYGFGLHNPEFKPIRALLGEKGQSKNAKQMYDSLRDKLQYISLPPWTNINNAKIELGKWEEENREKCERTRDEGQFFGFSGVAEGYLGRHTKFLFIPAVKDASKEAAEGRGSVITDLMDLVVRSILAEKDALRSFREETQRKYDELLDPSALPELNALADVMSNTLGIFAPNARINLNWLNLEEIDIPLPKVNVKLVEDDYSTDVGRTGHGLQRAFILTMLQHLVLAQAKDSKLRAKEEYDQSSEVATALTQKDMSDLPNLVLAIEEPELYQHPS